MKKAYAQTQFGQIHTYRWAAKGSASHPPLVCLHPIPYGGIYYKTIAPLLGEGREIISLDYPGYGNSDAIGDKPSIREYAQAIIEALDELGISKPYDLFGFHTGCLVGPEMALIAPSNVRRLILIDVPYFDKAQQEAMYDKVVVPNNINHDISSLEKFWNFTVRKRMDEMPFDRGYELFIEQAKAGNGEYLGFHAAFTYPCEDLFPKNKHETLIMATTSGLLEPTRSAAKILPKSKLIECLDITSSVMETGIEQITEHTLEFLQ